VSATGGEEGVHAPGQCFGDWSQFARLDRQCGPYGRARAGREAGNAVERLKLAKRIRKLCRHPGASRELIGVQFVPARVPTDADALAGSRARDVGRLEAVRPRNDPRKRFGRRSGRGGRPVGGHHADNRHRKRPNHHAGSRPPPLPQAPPAIWHSSSPALDRCLRKYRP